MLSHEHFDHMSMAPDLLRRLPVGHVAVNNHFGKTAAGRHMLAAFRSHDIPVSAMRAGDCLRVGSTCVHILNPPHDWEINPPPGELLNETSLVALVRSEVGQVMLTGDAGLSALAPLVFADHTTGGVDVLQAPHHGTPSMASAALLRKLRPRLVVASRSASAWLPGEIRTLPLPEATRYYDTALDGMTTITLSASASACVRTFLRRAESTAKAKPSPEGAEAHWQ